VDDLGCYLLVIYTSPNITVSSKTKDAKLGAGVAQMEQRRKHITFCWKILLDIGHVEKRKGDRRRILRHMLGK
jgi:hypothetical protein